MNFPKLTDLILYINKALTGADWNSNWQKIINWLTLGTYDLKVNKIETNEIENSGTFTQNGDLIADNIQADTIQSNNFVGNGANLTNVKVADIFAYTPFSVNSAKANFVVNDTTKITFDIDEEHPLMVTSAKGEQIKITSINDYDVSGLNGTYYVFVDENSNGGTAYLKSCTIYAQNTEPIGNNGDVWFDVSNEPYVCREKVSNNWYSDEYDKVPVAKVVVTGGNIDSLDNLYFNNNEVDVKIVESYRNGNDWYRVWSNGFIEQGGYESNISSSGKTITFLKPFTKKPQILATNNEYNNRIPCASDISKTSFLLRFRSGGDSSVSGTGSWYAYGI